MNMKTIVEIGAHTGIETLKFLTDIDAQVYAFEPEQHLFKPLYQLSRQYPRLTVLPFAVDIGDNQEPLFHYGDGKSTLDPPAFGASLAKFTMTWTIRLDTFMRLYGIDRIDYLRIDAPWREEMCLESLGDRANDVVSGRIRKYDTRSFVPGWLLDHGFSMELDTVSDNITEPDMRFWRS
jgi:FkbM family methyltransferase